MSDSTIGHLHLRATSSSLDSLLAHHHWTAAPPSLLDTETGHGGRGRAALAGPGLGLLGETPVLQGSSQARLGTTEGLLENCGASPAQGEE